MQEKDRVIAVKDPAGRWIHSACADTLGTCPPSKNPFPDTISAGLASRIAAAGGSRCEQCSSYIVAPVKKAATVDPEKAWQLAHEQFLAGKITADAFIAAAQAFARSRGPQTLNLGGKKS